MYSQQLNAYLMLRAFNLTWDELVFIVLSKRTAMANWKRITSDCI